MPGGEEKGKRKKTSDLFFAFSCLKLIRSLLAAVRLHPPKPSVLIIPLHSSPSPTTPSPSSPLFLTPQPTTLGATRFRERFLKTDRLPRHYNRSLGFLSVLGASISRSERNDTAPPFRQASPLPAFPIIQRFTRTRSPIYYPVQPNNLSGDLLLPKPSRSLYRASLSRFNPAIYSSETSSSRPPPSIRLAEESQSSGNVSNVA